MRIIIDIMIGAMLVAVIAGGLYLYNSRQESERQVETVRAALQQLQEQAAYHRTVQSAMAGHDVLLVHLHAEWFGENLPTNVLTDDGRPWIDLAPPGDLGVHPPDPVVIDKGQAGFWYNPTTGVFRARVSPAASEALTLALYNEVNGSELAGFDVIPDTSRAPLAHTPGQTPAKQYASMANKTWSQAPEEDKPRAIDVLAEEDLDLAPEPISEQKSEQVSPEVVPDFKNQVKPGELKKTPPAADEGGLSADTRPTLEQLKQD